MTDLTTDVQAPTRFYIASPNDNAHQQIDDFSLEPTKPGGLMYEHITSLVHDSRADLTKEKQDKGPPIEDIPRVPHMPSRAAHPLRNSRINATIAFRLQTLQAQVSATS